MADANPGSGDVESALDLFIGDRPGQPVTPSKPVTHVVAELKPAPKPKTQNRKAKGTSTRANEASSDTRPKARTGRPPGIRPNESRPKDKTSLALDRELMDFYRKQSWAEECQLGELVERALQDYASKTWRWNSAGKSTADGALIHVND